MAKLSTKLFSTALPSKFERVNDYQMLYNHNIEESEADGVSGYSYDSLEVDLVSYPITSNLIFKTLIEEIYPVSVENKLRNDYESAKLGIVGQDKEQAYLEFLTRRKAIHVMVEQDCEENGIEL